MTLGKIDANLKVLDVTIELRRWSRSPRLRRHPRGRVTAGSRPHYRRVMDSPLASILGLLFTAVALYGFYWVIRLAVRDGMLDADRRRSRALASTQPAEPAPPGQPAVAE